MDTSATGARSARSSGRRGDRRSPLGRTPVTVSLVGSTGSIGTQALEVIEALPDRFRGGGPRGPPLGRRAGRPGPPPPSRGGGHRRPDAGRRAGAGRCPPASRWWRAPRVWPPSPRVADVAVNGVVGFAGLPVTLAALEAGRRLALANKESIIAGAPVVQRARRTPGAEIIPVDSEHCAIHQCLRAGRGRRGGAACC